MWSLQRVAATAVALAHVAAADDGYCPNIFYDAARVILRSPFLLSTDPSINFQCHSCIANLAAKQAVAPLCYVIGMEGYDPQYNLAKDCHCLSLGLMEECAPVCLPNPLCSKSSPTSACSACVNKQAPASCNRDEWNVPCYETCQQPKCITECSPTPQCHPADPICSACVKSHTPTCDTTAVSFGRQWGAACTAGCYSTACQADCNRRCGDGIKTSDELCDDGNSNNNDGCSTSCQIEVGFACTTDDHALSACNLITCGDGRLEGSETCDDGNIINGDGCSSSCQIERGAVCDQPHQLTKSLCSATCGDGVHAVGLEGCDDGNLIAGDGCSPTCGVERGYACAADAKGKSTCSPVCGDGIVTGKEKCDDKNTAPFDGCSDTCTVEPGYKCETNAQGVSVCLASCGDGITAFPVEACDDANRVSGDGCSLECKVEKGYRCTPPSFDGKTSVCAPICGNALLTGAEKCDDGNTIDDDGCSSSCAVEVGWSCDNSFTKAAKSVCGPVCGDGIVKGWEECDETSRGCVNCKKVEVPPPRCGDGYTDAGETCDDGNSVSGDGCSATCQVESGYVCSGRVCQGVCGNGVKTSAEACDDNNVVNGDGCSSSCTVETGYTCKVSDAGLSTCTPTCGDGKIIAPETCDDGNTAAGDGCSSTCKTESGFLCTTLSTGVSNCRAVCGDGIVAGGEACDDGNTRSSDGCSSTCRIESGFTCTRSNPSVCSTVCGDGIRTSNEACDDGNTFSKDGCSSNCTIETGFDCTTPLASASSCTQVPTCGDGYLSDSEYCDDGNSVSGDGCSKRCRVEALYTCVSPQANAASVCTKSKCSNVRKDWYQLTADEKATTQACVTKLYQTGLYQKMTGIHVFKPNDQYAHHTNAFVQWHRKWLLIMENMLRSMGGACSCLTLPYWDWTQDAVAMQTTNCASRSQCSGVLRDWGGGASTTSKFVSIPIFNDPLSGAASGSATGYCVLNEVTKDWHAGMELHKYKTAWDPTCPIIRRGWDDFSDDNGFFASPLASSSFLNLASSLARATDYAAFATISLGDIHVLPHDRSGAYLRTFISPADPVFLLHHTNIDRVYALWEACHRCTNPSRATRTTEGPCYRGTDENDGINDPFVFQFFDPLGNDQYRQVDIDDAEDMAEYVPRPFKTPGDVMDTTTLGEYAYTYQTNDMDDRLWSSSGCASRPTPSILTQLMASPPRHVDLTMLLATADADEGGTNSTYSAELAQQYLEWVDGVFTNAHHVLTTLQESNLFSIPYLSSQVGKLQSTEAYLADIVATCECMAINKLLLARNGEEHLTPTFVDVSASTKRAWNNRFELRSCFHRMLDTDEKSVLTRSYCDVILAPDFSAKLQNLVNDLRGLVSSFVDPKTTGNTIQQIWDFFTKG